MTFISYAQNFEDVMLWRALQHVSEGFYIDVGANDPRLDSVTCSFYERGWSGINIEPVSYWHEKLLEERPRDLSLKVAISDKPGPTILYEVDGTGLSTLSEESARSAQDAGWAYQEVTVVGTTLNDIWSTYVESDVHFLKVDVEGAEAAVFRSVDLQKYRPWIVLVEATKPGTEVQSHESYEGLILGAGYQFLYFDGINRFYASIERFDQLAPHFAIPPNYFDNFMRWSEYQAQREIERLNLRIALLDQMVVPPPLVGTKSGAVRPRLT